MRKLAVAGLAIMDAAARDCRGGLRGEHLSGLGVYVTSNGAIAKGVTVGSL